MGNGNSADDDVFQLFGSMRDIQENQKNSCRLQNKNEHRQIIKICVGK